VEIPPVEQRVSAVLEHGIDPEHVEAPAAAIEYARRLAQRGVPMVALAAGPAGRLVTAFADIRPIALMASDVGAVRAWVLDTLGELTVEDEQHERLRTTLRVFLSTGGSYTATADRLMMHKNTVHYRVNRAEEIRGRSFHDDRAV
jgi:DNA-binding PucR family transcriptional regulator